MAHYSEMDFLFSKSNRESVNQQLDNDDNTKNIFDNSKYVVYKTKRGGEYISVNGEAVWRDNNTQGIKNYIREQIYDKGSVEQNPYIKLLENFKTTNGTPGAGLRIKASDLAYLKDLGVYPINRMAILRRFPEGAFVPENLDEMIIEPISTVIGWLKPEESFPEITFNETWGTTNERFDTLMAKILNERLGIDIKSMIPVPMFAQGLLFEFYKYAGITEGTNEETGEEWNYKNIPVGDPNMLMEGPFRDPSSQNITSSFSFNLETTYEQKMLGDVDPGSAMLDIIDNLYAMGTSNMKFYWGEKALAEAKVAAGGKGNSPEAWWTFIKTFMLKFWTAMKGIFTDIKDILINKFNQFSGTTTVTGNTAAKASSVLSSELLYDFAQTILTSTIAIYRFEIRGSIELMTGSRDSSTPWYLTIGNPYSPWLASNHIIVQSATISTSTEMGFNDQPQWVKIIYSCKFSRALGQQELMRMLNNTFRRNYNDPTKIYNWSEQPFLSELKDLSAEERISSDNKSIDWWNGLSSAQKRSEANNNTVAYQRLIAVK